MGSSVFGFSMTSSINLDGPGYALTLLLVGEILIIALVFAFGFGDDEERSFNTIHI